MPLQQTTFENILAKGEIAHDDNNIDLKTFSINVPIYVQCCLREKVDPFPHTTILQQTTLNMFYQKIENLYN